MATGHVDRAAIPNQLKTHTRGPKEKMPPNIIVETAPNEPTDPNMADWHELSVARRRGVVERTKDFILAKLDRHEKRDDESVPDSLLESCVEERHHKFYGRPWCLGRDHADHLLDRGLKPSDNFLDLGCGSLRTGVFVIPHLDSSRYFGMDAHKPSLEAAACYEIPLNDLEIKKPRLLHSSQFELEYWNTKFNWIFAFALFKKNHVGEDLQRIAFEKISRVLADDGVMVISPPLDESQIVLIAEYGLAVSHQEVQICKIIDDQINWMEIIKA